MGDAREREEAVFKVSKQKGAVAQILDRLSLRVKHSFYSLDDLVVMSEEEAEERDVGLKRHADSIPSARRQSSDGGNGWGLTVLGARRSSSSGCC